MGNIDNILKKHAKRLGIERQVEAVGVVERATEIIAQYIPKEDFEVISFKDGVLKIVAQSPVLASEIRLKDQEVKKLVEEVKKVFIKTQ